MGIYSTWQYMSRPQASVSTLQQSAGNRHSSVLSLFFFPSKRGESIFPFEKKNQHHNDETIADQVPSDNECHFHSVFHEDNNHHGAKDGGDLCSTSLSSPCTDTNDKNDNDCSSAATVTSHTYKPSSFLLHHREGIIKASTQR